MKTIRDIKNKLSQINILRYAILISVLLISSSCIKDDLSDCPIIFSLQIQAVDNDNLDITSSGQAGDVQLYIFDNTMHYLDKITVTAEEVKNVKTLNLSYISNNNLWVVAWSNLNGNQNIIPTSFSRNTTIDEALIQLKRNTQEYAVNPDDLFYGITNIKTQRSNSQIVIRRKTALINITVSGISPQPQDDYYFVVRGAEDDAYNFKGELTGGPISYKQAGGFVNSPTLLNTIEPLRIYPLSAGNTLTIEVYRGQQLLASVNSDSQGNDIIPITGMTSNILIDLTKGNASMEVKIEITNWDDLYRWVEW